MNKEQVEAICLETIRTALNDYKTVRAELELYKTGKIVPMPVDKDHAKMMLIIAMSHLGLKAGEPVSFAE